MEQDIQDVLISTDRLPWLALGAGTWFKLLRASKETGTWSALLKMETGAKFSPHRHLAAADFYVIKGAFEYRGGSARAGDYGYEPLGVVHDATTCVEETVFMFNAYGPIIFLNDNGSVDMILDYDFVTKAAASGETGDFSIAGHASG